MNGSKKKLVKKWNNNHSVNNKTKGGREWVFFPGGGGDAGMEKLGEHVTFCCMYLCYGSALFPLLTVELQREYTWVVVPICWVRRNLEYKTMALMSSHKTILLYMGSDGN